MRGELGLEPCGLGHRRLRDVDVRRIEHDVVMRDEPVIGDDALAPQIVEHPREQRLTKYA